MTVTDHGLQLLVFDCPFCAQVVVPTLVKWHLARHDDVPAKEMDVVFVRWLGARDLIPAETAVRLVALLNGDAA